MLVVHNRMSRTILSEINSPEDLKKLSATELSSLAEEIRKEIISTVSHNGGHLSSNLGVIELTIALHSVFASPQDSIIWDVGHQCYTHKLLVRMMFSVQGILQLQFQALTGS